MTDALVRALDGGPQLWTRSGWGYRVDNRDQLLRAIGRVATLSQRRIYAWRGQRDASWPLVSSLYRHLAKSGSVDEQRMREVERQIVREARKYGLGRDLGASNTDAHLLASLQHHGTPTRLIDVTSNPFTALWFACQDKPGATATPGVLFAVDVTAMPWADTFDHGHQTFGTLVDPLSAQYEQLLTGSREMRSPFRLFPAVPDERMSAQEGYFVGSEVSPEPRVPGVLDLDLVGGSPPPAEALKNLLVGLEERGPGRPAQLPFLALVIPAKVKRAMRDPLKGTFNRRRRVLFPDVDGFREAFHAGEVDLETPGSGGARKADHG